MGCSSSKVDDLEAVALCRERCAFLDEAIHLRYSLAEAHMAYIHSLKGVGHSLHNFIEESVVVGVSSGSPLSPKLNLPPHRKGDPVGNGGSAIDDSGSPHHHLSHSNSGSHLDFHSDSDDESGSLHHSDHSPPFDLQHGAHMGYMIPDQGGFGSFPGAGAGGGGGGGGGGFMHMNYMRKSVTPSVVYEQRPVSPEKVYHAGESSSSSGHYPYPYPNMAYNNPYPYYGYPPQDGGYYGGSGFPPPAYGSMSSAGASGSSSKPAPPPPSPPRASAWDFLNPFETYDKYYSAYTPSRDSKEVREEEGIPDLEDENYQHEVVKEVLGNQKFVDEGGGGGGGSGKGSKKAAENERGGDDTKTSLYQTRPSTAVEDDAVEYEVREVDKKVDKEEKSEERGNGGAFKGRPGSRDVYEVAKEIEVQFERASESGNEIAKMLEAGKLPYQRKHVSSKMLHVVAPSLSMVASQPSTSKSDDPSSSAAELSYVEELGMASGNLSSTLRKLYLWEKKLYNEVKAEEKMRVIHERKCRKLKRLDERGAEAHKVDTTQTLVKSLSTKIRIAIQVVDKISMTINKIRDEELWPQLNELIQGLTRMWRSMLDCHRAQYQAISESKSLGLGSGKSNSEAHLGATKELEHELLNWTMSFSSWISAQKGYVRALNNWLLKCLMDEPEETPDGIAPFSPGRMGAPLVFVICNQWAQALDRLSEKEVVDSMRVFSMSVLQIWEHDKLEMRQRMMANKDSEGKVRNLDRDDQKIQKQIQALDKKMVMVSRDERRLSVSGNAVYQSEVSNISLQSSLQRIFEAMERFTADSMKVYEDLLQRSEEERLSREEERGL